MERSFQIERDKSVLVIIDVQDGLLKAMAPEIGGRTIKNIRTLIVLAKEMEIPLLVTEQYPRGLGETAPEIKEELKSIPIIEKVAFSCCHADPFMEQLEALKRKQVLLSGMETHVCVLQTAADLIQAGYDIHVVADGVCSRRKLDWEVGLRWMENHGATISTTEIVAFQLLKKAGTEEFKKLSKLIK